ncbi:hypothetical protein H5410_061938 [Solanum commersonii]|uniref:Uncharacterized protein n=1 Tax=Solanum commersonii TaxID=4109 RepID=A0A9J5WA81_SOLCO|nr:hypothetical protein H5410_061938 [Solanum commersonii]
MVYAFTIPLGIGTNYQAETQATTHGIYWFVQHGYERINFWDNLLGDGYLPHHCDSITGLNNTTISQFLVKGNCNEAVVRQWVPPLLVPKVLSTRVIYQ